MRKLCLFSLIIVAGTYKSFGQVRNEFFRSLFVDIEGNAGIMTGKIKAIPFSTNYTDALNAKQSGISYKNAFSTGANFNLGYYFDRKRTWGIGAGFSYSRQMSDLKMDTFHVEYKSVDDSGGTFRQLISTTHGITERVTTTNMSIPILLRWKKSFSEDFFITVDAGIVYNLQTKNTYTTNAEFDYEAIYRYEGKTPVYDYNAVPDASDFLITRKFFTTKYPGDDVYSYFKFQDSIGRSVGLNQKAISKGGDIKYKSGSLGYTAQAAVNFKIVKNVYARGGVYYTMQRFTNTSTNNSMRLTDAQIKDASGKTVGVNYNSLLNEVQDVTVNNFGLFLGVRVYINRTAWKYPENDMNKITPATGHGL